MFEWNGSAFLQALGWATLNSFWQMGLLWCCYLGADYLFKLSSHKKYIFSVTAITTGFIWFVGTFIFFLTNASSETFAISDYSINQSNYILQVFLTSASITYLVLLIIPAYKLYSNWRFVQKLKSQGLKKADVHYKLFVQKIAAQLGIKKSVKLYISELIKSPVTIGYLKPIILLPVASLNNLTVQQTEAVLLHELSHIKRYDYLVNILLSIVHTFLYFNPFVKLFLRIVEEERENCCDQMVLQFDYDKVSYASALLTLEKTSSQNNVLAIGAAGKKHLLNRIEKIVGMEKKPVFNFNYFAGLAAALLCILVINSVIITSKQNFDGDLLSFNSFENAVLQFDAKTNSFEETPGELKEVFVLNASKKDVPSTNSETISVPTTPHTVVPVALEIEPQPFVADPNIIQVATDDVEMSLTAEEKKNVSSIVSATKKVLKTTQWKNVENSIAEVMTEQEKEHAKREYLREIENLNWDFVEKNLKASYDKLDLNKVNNYLGTALADAKLDSLETSYNTLLKQIEIAEVQVKNGSTVVLFPDESMEKIRVHKAEIKRCLENVKSLKSTKKIISL